MRPPAIEKMGYYETSTNVAQLLKTYFKPADSGRLLDPCAGEGTAASILAKAALQRFEFTTCDGRGEVWQLWTNLRKEHRTLVIQFRHSESDWSRGLPEFVDLEKNEPLGFVNIAGRLFCKVK